MDINIPGRITPAGNSPQSQVRTDDLNIADADTSKEVDGANPAPNLGNAESEQNVTQSLESSVVQLNELVQSIERDLHFSIDEASGDTVIQVLDSKTEEVIRQIPSEEVLTLARNIETMKGILFSAEV